MSGELFLDLIILSVGAAILGLTVGATLKDKKHWYQYIAVLVWSTHSTIFYVISALRTIGLFNPIIGQALHDWSIVLRLHDIITIACLIYIIRLKDLTHG